MSNGYNDYRIEMESNIKYFKRDDKLYVGIHYLGEYEEDSITYQFCDLMCEDVKQQNGDLIIQVGTEYKNYTTGEYERNYEYTVYLPKDYWIMCNAEQKLFVVDNRYINDFIQISEQEYICLRKKQ